MLRDPVGHERSRVNSSRQFDICSNISTETMRSTLASGWNTLASAVMMRTLLKPRSAARASMKARCDAEFDTAVIREFG